MTIFKREFKKAKARTSVTGVGRQSSLTTIFDHVIRRFKKEKAKQESSELDRRSLFVHISDMNWEIASANENSENGVEKDRRNEDCSLLKANVPDRIEAIFGRAVKSLSRSDRRLIDSIHILLTDQSIIILDDVSGELQTAEPGAIRQIAQRQLNCQSASYGHAELQGAGGAKSLYGMVDTAVLRSMVHQLGDLAPKVVNIAPTEELLMQPAARLGRPYCALIMSAYNTKFIFTDMVNDCAIARMLPIGIMSFPAAVAEHTRVKLKNAQSGLEKRDIIATLNIDDGTGETGQPLSKSPFHDAMAPLLLSLKSEVEETLRYVADQRLGQQPEKIEIFGDVSKINGLTNWLDANLALPIETSQQDILELFTTADMKSVMNLMTGSEEQLVSVGKTNYDTSKESPSEDASTPEAYKKKKLDQAQQNGRRQGRNNQHGRGAASTPNKGGLFGLSFLNFGTKGNSEAGKKQSDSVYYLLIAALFFGILYWAYINFYEGAARKHRNARLNYEQALSSNNTAWRQLKERPSKMKDLALRAKQDVDKVLWSEKMLAIAKHMDDKMWISDVYLVNESTVYNSQSVSARKLTIEGAVLPSTTGHILEIARYISRLTEDKLFMRDFSRITFEGAAIDTLEAAHVVKFTLGAWYDKTKVKKLEEKEDGGGPTAKLKKKVNRRTNELERVRDGGNLDHIIE